MKLYRVPRVLRYITLYAESRANLSGVTAFAGFYVFQTLCVLI